MNASRALPMAVWMLAGCGVLLVTPPATRADQKADLAAAAASDEVIRMQAFIVSAARIGKPWYYGSLPEFEILSRSADQVTNWQRKAILRGLFLENAVLPKDWLPQSP